MWIYWDWITAAGEKHVCCFTLKLIFKLPLETAPCSAPLPLCPSAPLPYRNVLVSYLNLGSFSFYCPLAASSSRHCCHLIRNTCFWYLHCDSQKVERRVREGGRQAEVEDYWLTWEWTITLMTEQYFFIVTKSFSSCFFPVSSCHFLLYLVKAFFLLLCLKHKH